MFGFLKQVISEFGQVKAGQMSAAFAYIAVFAIGPMLLVLVSLVGFIYGQKAAQGQLFEQLSSVMGSDTARSLQNVIAQSHNTGKGTIALVIGTVGLLLAATGLSAQLQNSFNTIYRAVKDPKSGIKSTIYIKFKNIALLFLGSLILAASLFVSVLVNSLGQNVQDSFGLPPFGLEALNTGVSLLVFVLFLYFIYRVIPDVVIPRKIVLAVSIAIGLLFLVGKIILGIVIGRNGTASAYGAAASVIILLLWFYYIAQILLGGAVASKVYAERHNIDLPAKRYNLKQKSLQVNIKKDFRGRLVTAFTRGYKTKK